MSTISIDLSLFRAAIRALGITAPVYSAIYTDSGEVAITTRDGTLIWSPGDAAPIAEDAGDRGPIVRDDLTLIPQVGEVTQTALNKLGLFTFADLARADVDLLLSVMPRRTLRCVVHYIQTNHPKITFGG
jgi:hypothetical protein